jgi:hypothetical protein
VPSYNIANVRFFRLGPIVKYGSPILTDQDVTEAVESLPITVDIVGGVAVTFNNTFWRKVLSNLIFLYKVLHEWDSF